MMAHPTGFEPVTSAWAEPMDHASLDRTPTNAHTTAKFSKTFFYTSPKGMPGGRFRGPQGMSG